MSSTELNPQIIAKIVARLKEELLDVKEIGPQIVEQFKSFHLRTAVALLFELVEGCVRAVEEVASEISGVAGADKAEAVVQFLNSVIEIPLCPEWLEEKFIRAAINRIVGKLNFLHNKRGWFMGGIEHAKKIFSFAQLAVEE